MVFISVHLLLAFLIVKELSLLVIIPLALQVVSIAQLVQLEGLPVLASNVIDFGEAIEIVDEMQHLLVGLVLVERNDRDPIVDLEGEAVDRVVDDDHILEVPLVFEDPHVFYVVAFFSQEAVVPVEPCLDQLKVWIDVVQDSVCVCLVACSEHDYLEVLAGLLQALHDERPNIDSSVNSLFIGEVNLKNDIWILCFNIVHAMDQGLIHIKDHQLLLIGCSWLR